MVKRCSWVDENSTIYKDYHDNEWGKPVYDDEKLYEMFLLETFQAGLSWITILKKRESFKIMGFLYRNSLAISTFTGIRVKFSIKYLAAMALLYAVPQATIFIIGVFFKISIKSRGRSVSDRVVLVSFNA